MAFDYHVTPEVDIPLYLQLVDMLRSDIHTGRLPEGTRLPTVRELSSRCSIARGTVMRAYDELEQTGFIEKIQGRGTFVCEKKQTVSRKDQAMAAIDAMLDTLENLNFSQTEMNIYLNLKLQERASSRKDIRVAVVECNNEILHQVSSQISSLGDVSVSTFRLEDVLAYPYYLDEELDLIVVSANHAQQLLGVLPEKSKMVKAAFRLMPHSVSQIVRIEGGSRVGILCQSTRFGSLVKSVCADYTENVRIAEPQSFQSDVESYLRDKDVLLVPSDWRRFCGEREQKPVEEFSRNHPVIECRYLIDEGSFMYVEDRINRIRSSK